MSEPDELSGIDLTAWQVPEPPAGLADRVVARMREPISAAAAEPATAPVAARWWLGGGTLAAAAIVALVVLCRAEPETRTGEPSERADVAIGSQSRVGRARPISTNPGAKPARSGATELVARNIETRLRQLELGCEDGDYRGALLVTVRVNAAGRLVEFATEPRDASVAGCLRDALDGNQFGPSPAGTTARTPLQFAGCDRARLERDARDSALSGRHAEAVEQWERAFACRPEAWAPTAHELRDVVIAACKSGNRAKAAQYLTELADAEPRAAALAACAAARIDLR